MTTTKKPLIEASRSPEDLQKWINTTLTKRETETKTLIKGAVKDMMAHLIEHGQIQITNDLCKAVTPANRLAVVKLVQACTIYVWDGKAKAFKGKKENANSDEIKVAKRNLMAFVTKYDCDIWEWYEKEIAEKVENLKFSEKSFVKMISTYAAIKRKEGKDPFEGLDTLFEAAKSQAANQDAIENKVKELITAGLEEADARKAVQKMVEQGKFQPKATEPAETKQAAKPKAAAKAKQGGELVELQKAS